MSVIIPGRVNCHRRMISVESDPDAPNTSKYNVLHVTLQGDQREYEALLDTGADANLILSEIVSAFKLKSTPHEQVFEIGDGNTFRTKQKVSVNFQILRPDRSYSALYTETFLIIDKRIGGYAIALGKTFCEDNHILTRSDKFAVMVHKQSKDSKATNERTAADRHAKRQEDFAIVEMNTKAKIAEERANSYPGYGSSIVDASTNGQNSGGSLSADYSPVANVGSVHSAY